MHILLTDRLSCPRCGPEFGLILLGDRIEDRRVHDGVLGCPNCREHYPVRDGFGDLRAPPRRPLDELAAESPPEDGPEADDPEATLRLAALLGVREGPGHLLVVGPASAHAPALARMIEEIEVVTLWPGNRSEPERAGVSRLVAGPGLPFFSRTLRGVALSGEGSGRWLDEAVRTVAPMGRVVVLDASPSGGGADAHERLAAAGLEVVLDESQVVVAARS